MKIEVTAREFSSAIHKTAQAVERRNTIPVLDMGVLIAGKGVIKIGATNMDLWTEFVVDGTVIDEGSVLIPIFAVAGLLKGAEPDDVVTISGDKDGPASIEIAGPDVQMAWSSGTSIPTSDFPMRPREDDDYDFSIGIDGLRSLLQRVRFAISTEETRYYLNGVYLHADGDALISVATDGHRMAIYRLAEGVNGFGFSNHSEGVIIPRKAVAIILANLPAKGSNQPVRCSISKSRRNFTVNIGDGDTVIFAKLIDGTFPDYRRVVPDRNDRTTMTIERGRLSRVIKSMSGASMKKHPSIKFDLEGATLGISHRGDSGGAVSSRLPVAYGGRQVAFGVNGKYCADMMREFSGDLVDFAVGDASDAILVSSEADPGFACVQMPMRV